MNLSLKSNLADKYTSSSQKIRVLTENWVNNEIYCPNCGKVNIDNYENNRPVADFFCKNCKEDFELKSSKKNFDKKIIDGAYRTMVERLQSNDNPNFFLLNYDLQKLDVTNFFIIPKYFFTTEIIEKRKPLAPTAVRAGWVGCNILCQNIPQTGKIFLVKNNKIESKDKVLNEWQKTLFLKEEKEVLIKNWLLDVMFCIDKLGKNFNINQIYNFENFLKQKHPENNHIKDKIRQQLQILRDKGYLKFTERGNYQVTS